MTDREEYIDENKVVVDVKPHWKVFAGRMGCLFILLIIASSIALYIVNEINRQRNSGGVSAEWQALSIFIFFVLFIGPGAYLALHVFWLLRGRWSIRVTPKALLYRGWFNILEIPWDEIATIPVPPEPKITGKKASLHIYLKKVSMIPKQLPFSLKSQFSIVPNIGNFCLIIGPTWMQHEPEHLAKILEKYREKFSTEEGDGEDI